MHNPKWADTKTSGMFTFFPEVPLSLDMALQQNSQGNGSGQCKFQVASLSSVGCMGKVPSYHPSPNPSLPLSYFIDLLSYYYSILYIEKWLTP